jgi:hypothetical protein
MSIKKTFAPKRLNTSIAGFQDGYEPQRTVAKFHSDLCNRLLQNPVLKSWERLFIKTLAASRNPGRKQLQKLEAIASRLNERSEN